MSVAAFSLSDVQALAERLAHDLLDNYTQSIRNGVEVVGRKEINDPLWGTISLTPLEVAVLDSPLIQRLRSIRQLGVAHWVYPGAIHTRFEHTLGVLHQIHNLAAAINTLGAQQQLPNLIDTNYQQTLRLCALFHDIGHAAFSHVSEFAFEYLPNVGVLSAEFSRTHKCEARKLSEIIAYFVMRSPAMRVFFEVLFDRYGNVITFATVRSDNVTILIEKISSAIVGKKIDDQLPLLHELISGPFDADKLDYFVRDARLAGIPSLLDISRLIQKISIRELSIDELPDDIGRSVDKISGKYILFGIKWSGVAVLDELHLARVLLYSKVYRHTKVVAIEQMLRGAILAIAPACAPQEIIKLFYHHHDEALLAMSAEQLAKELAINISIDESRSRLETAVTVLQSIRARRLSVKAFEIQTRYSADPLEKDPAQKAGLTEFREDIEHPQRRTDVWKKLLDEVENIMTLLGRQVPNRIMLEAEVTLHAAAKPSGGTQISRAYLLPSSGKPIAFREYQVNRTAWAESYMSDQPSGHIFAPPDIADLVYIGTEKILRTLYGVRLPNSAIDASKRTEKRLQQLKKSLTAKGYYRGTPFDIRPIPDRLRRADADQIIGRMAAKLIAYHEPQSGDRVIRYDLDQWRARIVEWLCQFETDEFVDCALHLLDHFRFIDRPETVAALKAFVAAHPKFAGGIVVPFGNARDSGSLQAYFSADAIGTHVSACSSLEEAAKDKSGKPIIFIDDFAGSGGQARDILAAGFGIESLRQDLGEQRGLFDGEVQSFLRRVETGFVFVAAWDSGLSEIEAAAKAHDLRSTVYGHIKESELPFAFGNCLHNIDTAVRNAFQERCSQIGAALLNSSPETNRSGKADQRALGYGNRGMLLGSPFNIPTQTLTLIWKEGEVDGADWTPLMARRRKT